MCNPGDEEAVAGAVDIHRRGRPPLDDDTLVGAYWTDLRLHQDRPATTEATYTSHLGTFREYLAEQYPDMTLPDVQAVHVKAYLLALAARGIAPATRSATLFVAALLLRVPAFRGPGRR